MEQLSAHDASFVYLETANAHMAGGSLSFYDPSTAPGGKVTFQDIVDNTERRLHLAQMFRRKLVRVPMDLDYPYWVDDANFDIEYHIREIGLPKPGDWRQLCIQTARLMARPLDLNKPLWEMYVIEGIDAVEGVPKGSFAVVSKTHHAAMDGASGMEMLTALHDLVPDAPAPERQPWTPEREPTPPELMARTAANNFARPARYAAAMARAFGANQERMWRGEPPQIPLDVPPPLLVPPTIFNASVSPHRVLDARRFELDEIKRIKNTVPGATVNDVMLTIVGGALRKYLDAHSALPPDSLISMCPISLRSKDDKATGGNQVGAMTVSIGTNIANPAVRLQAVQRATAQSKMAQEGIDAQQLTELTQQMPGALMGIAARMTSDMGAAAPIPPYNTVVTNVPGPQFPLYSGGARLVRMIPLGIVHDGMGLMNVVSSYCGEIVISFTADRDMMADPAFYAECIQSSYEELAKATA